MRVQNSFIQIDGIGEATEQHLWTNGITEWEHALDATCLRADQREAVSRFVEDGLDAVHKNDLGYFANRFPNRSAWRLTETFRSRCLALDIETTGLDAYRDDVTTVSFHDPHGTETLVNGRDLTRNQLSARFEETSLLVTFNGKRFDIPFLEQTFGMEIDVPHLDLLYPCRRLGLTGGLSAVEQELDITRELPDVDGREAVRLWHRYRRGDDDALERLITYNQEDTTVLLPVLDHVHERLERDVFLPHVSK